VSNEIRKSIELYAALAGPDRRHASYFMSEETFRALKRATPTYINGPETDRKTVLGIPVKIDNTMPEGVIDLCAVRSVTPAQPAPIIPEPTVRALVRHWIKKLRKR